jgi:glutaredoxin
MPQVKIYTTTWCAFCRAEKQYLTERKVEFQNVDVENDQAAADEMIHLSGQAGVPFTVITKGDGSKVGILGFDRPRLSAELGLK